MLQNSNCFENRLSTFLELADNTKNLRGKTSDISKKSNIERINAKTSNLENSLILLLQKFVSMSMCPWLIQLDLPLQKKKKTKTFRFVSSCNLSLREKKGGELMYGKNVCK